MHSIPAAAIAGAAGAGLIFMSSRHGMFASLQFPVIFVASVLVAGALMRFLVAAKLEVNG